MNFEQANGVFYLAAAIVLGVLWLAGRAESRRRISNAFLLLLTVFVGNYLYVAVSSDRLGKSNPSVAVDQAEMQLRVVSAIDSFTRNTEQGFEDLLSRARRNRLRTSLTPGQPGKQTAAEAGEPQRQEAFASARDALEKAIALGRDKEDNSAKLLILLGSDKKLSAESGSNLLSRLRSSSDEDDRQLADVLEQIYIKRTVSKSQMESYATFLRDNVSGWYQERALTDLYRTAKAQKELDAYVLSVDQNNIFILLRFSALVGTLMLAGLVGIINIFVQLALSARNKPQPIDAVGLDVPLKIIFGVFIAWFSIQLVLSSLLHLALGRNPQLTDNATLVALTTGAGYLISNLPAPLLIYYLALKPQGLSFVEALRLKWRTSTAGPVKIVFMGLLAWCSAIPLVVAAAVVASKLMSSAHSDNPVIQQIVQAASASSPMAIVLFYITLAVLAPFFEEILFRGYIYASLKKRIGALPSMLVSGALFAGMHFDRGGGLMLFAIGFVLAYTFERTRSLVPCMIAHGLWNAGSFTMALVLFSS